MGDYEVGISSNRTLGQDESINWALDDDDDDDDDDDEAQCYPGGRGDGCSAYRPAS